MQARRHDAFVPALRFHALTPFYDAVVALTTRERTFRRVLIEQAGIEASHRVLDLGCGTGTLAVAISRSRHNVRVVGIDADRVILSIARRKSMRNGIQTDLQQGDACNLPYADACFDRVVSTLFFHHLSDSRKSRALAETFRVLKCRGELHVVDWGMPSDLVMRALFLMVQALDGFDNTASNVAGRLPMQITEAGFTKVEERQRIRTILGSLSVYRAVK